MSDEKQIDWRQIQAELAAPFPASDIEWRIGSAGWQGNGNPWAMVLAYLTNRAIMQRLDDVVGCENWENAYIAGPQGGVLCGIGIHGVTKWDGADNTQKEAIKGGLSGSMKRAAVQWSIGRYLYGLEVQYADILEDNAKVGQFVKRDIWKDKRSNDSGVFKWRVPTLPAWALPKGEPPGPSPRPSNPEGVNVDHFIPDVTTWTTGQIVQYVKTVIDPHQDMTSQQKETVKKILREKCREKKNGRA